MATSKDKSRWNRDARLGAPKESMGTSLVRHLFKMPAPTTARPANTAPLQSKQTNPLLVPNAAPVSIAPAARQTESCAHLAHTTLWKARPP